MADRQPPEIGTLIIAALLILAIVFAGYWISAYAGASGRPWGVLPWFGAAAVAIVAVGALAYLRRGR